MSKAQSLSLTTIVIALLALIVLVVLIAIFTGKVKVFGKGADACVSRGGACITGSESVCEAQNPPQVYHPGTDCEQQGMVCCAKVYS